MILGLDIFKVHILSKYLIKFLCDKNIVSNTIKTFKIFHIEISACPAEYADKCEYWVDEGCSSDKNGPDDMEGFYQSQDSTAFVRCCKEGKNGPKCDTISDCSNEGDLVPYGEAAELCTNKGEGWRLCTKEELLSNICCKTGGGCHSVAVWTSTWGT